MQLRLAALVLLLAPIVAFGNGYKNAIVSEDQASLVLTTSDGSQFAAPGFAEQVAFARPRISPDGRSVGWLALYPNCCTSYPIPLKLVVLDESKHLHTFEGIKLAIFNWCFLPGSNAVAYSQTVVHGSNFQHFERRAIVDGRLLGAYEFPHEEAENMSARNRAPAWVRCVKE
jgi:hypothetical protein